MRQPIVRTEIQRNGNNDPTQIVTGRGEFLILFQIGPKTVIKVAKITGINDLSVMYELFDGSPSRYVSQYDR